MLAGKWTAWWSVPLMLVAIAAGTSVLPAQSTGDTPVPEPPVIDKTWPDVNLNVVVINKQGVPQTIDEHQFQLFEDGVERPLQFRGSPDSPVSIAFLIDCSGSMFRRQGSVTAAVHAILNGLPNGSEVTEVCFSDYAFLDLPFTPVSGIDYSFLDHMDGHGGTALYDTVVVTEKYLIAHAKYVRRALVILSDGEDNASQVSMAAAFRSMEQPGAPAVYVCPVSKANFLETQVEAGLIFMSGLAKWSGGIDINLDPNPEAAAAKVAAAIRSQMVVQFTAANPARNGKRHKLKLRLPDKDLEIRAIPEYFAPAK